MASLKIGSLLLRTLAKPIANRIKREAKEHDKFRQTTISFAQFLHRTEMTMRVKLLGETHPKHIRPLNDARAIDAGANFISESFLFAFAAAIILAESWRSRRKEQNRRDAVLDKIEQNQSEITYLKVMLETEVKEREKSLIREREVEKIVEEIVDIGLRGGFVELSDVWKRHNSVGADARRFGTSDRVKSLISSSLDDVDENVVNVIDGSSAVGSKERQEQESEGANGNAKSGARNLADEPLIKHLIKVYRERKAEDEAEEQEERKQ
ncbi:hypothetical protein ACM66B_004880 [Microbotryomycetes sp. NB124-2]